MNEMFHLTSAQTLDDDAHLLCARHLDHLDEFGEDTYRVEVFFVGRFCIFVLLAEYAEYGVWFLFQHPDEIQTFLSAHNDRGHVGRETTISRMQRVGYKPSSWSSIRVFGSPS